MAIRERLQKSDHKHDLYIRISNIGRRLTHLGATLRLFDRYRQGKRTNVVCYRQTATDALQSLPL